MQRELAEKMMAQLRALEAPVNALSTLSETLEGDERTRVRRSIGQIIATSGSLQLDIAKQYPDLNPDKAS